MSTVNTNEYLFNLTRSSLLGRIEDATAFVEGDVIEVDMDTDFIRVVITPEIWHISGDHNGSEFRYDFTRGSDTRTHFAIECLIFEARRIWREMH